MSIKLMTLAFRNKELTGNKRLALLALADNASDEGYCWPSYATIAKKVNITRRSAIRIVVELESLGYLRRTTRYKKENKMELSSNGYLLSESVMIAGSWEVVTEESPPSDRGVTRVVTEESPKPSIEPSFNQFEEEGEPPETNPNIFKLYEQNIGIITPIISDKLILAEEEYPADWFPRVFEIASENNARSWAYCSAILDRWKVDGFDTDSRPKKYRRSPVQLAEAYQEFLSD